MRVISVEPLRGEFVEVVGPPGFETDYIRHGADNWLVRMGESWESVYQSDDLEHAYQAYISHKVD